MKYNISLVSFLLTLRFLIDQILNVLLLLNDGSEALFYSLLLKHDIITCYRNFLLGLTKQLMKDQHSISSFFNEQPVRNCLLTFVKKATETEHRRCIDLSCNVTQRKIK